MEDPKAPENQDKQEELEIRPFNQEARDAIEAGFEAFQKAEAGEVVEEQPPAAAPAPAPDKLEADKGQVIDQEETWTPEFKDHREAEKSYKNARLKMQEATERASRLERENEELRRATLEALQNFRPPAQAEPGATPKKPPQMSEEQAQEMEAEFFKNPIGFLFAAIEAGRKASIEEFEGKSKAERDQERRQAAVQSFTNSTQKYFDDTYADLKPIEPLVTVEIQSVWKDADFMRPLMDDKQKAVIDKAKAVVDEATKRLRIKFPTIGKALGFVPADEPKKERLSSGAPPVVPVGNAGPTVRISAPADESNAEYMAGRRKLQDRMHASRMR